MNLEVMDKAFVEPWEWRIDGLNYQRLADDLIKMLTDNYQLQLQSRQQCVYERPIPGHTNRNKMLNCSLATQLWR